MKNLFGAAALVLASALAACGGGGGSAGDTKLPYSIALTVVKNQLPINIAGLPPSIGADAPYTTTLYVSAREGNAPIQGGKDIFACNIAQGLDTGSLVYLDGDHKVMVKDKDGNQIETEGLFRSVVLGANSGGNSFHFHAGNQAGTARVTCSVTNPADNQVSSASVDIIVGAATGKPASVIGKAQAPEYLGSQGNLGLIRNNVGIQAFLMDDANQPIPNPSAANLQISIRPFGAFAGARLTSGASSGSVLQVRTIGGVGLVSLSSGPNTGAILLEFTTDRFDNDVSNGIQDPVSSLMAVGVYDAISAIPLVFADSTLPGAKVGVPFAYAFSAQGGTPPYTWAATAGLPTGLTISSSGILQGTPSIAGSFNIAVTVTDSLGVAITSNVALTIAAGDPPPVPPQAPLTITCSGAVDTDCVLPDATLDDTYFYAFSATGGDPTKAIAWSFTPTTPPWLTTATTTGLISGKPVPADVPSLCTVKFLVTATRDVLSVSRVIVLKLKAGTPGC